MATKNRRRGEYRSSKKRPPQVVKGRKQATRGTKGRGDSAEARRELYHSDPAHAEKVKEQVRQSYRKNHPRTSTRLLESRGLLTQPTLREVEFNGDIRNEECFTINEAAEAIGRSPLTLKRWIKDEMIPPPALTSTSHGYQQYAYSEVEIIGNVLREHEKHYDYLHCTHQDTIHTLWQHIEAHRRGW